APCPQGIQIAVAPGAFDFQGGRAVEAEPVQRRPHPLQPVVHHAERLHRYSRVPLVSTSCGLLQSATAAGGGSDRTLSGELGLHRPEKPSGPEWRVAHHDWSVACADPLEPPAVPFRRVLPQPLNPGHERSPDCGARAVSNEMRRICFLPNEPISNMNYPVR